MLDLQQPAALDVTCQLSHEKQLREGKIYEERRLIILFYILKENYLFC